jgi:hypothetical protein
VLHQIQDAAQAGPSGERPLGRALDHRTVCQRIRERHTDFENVCASTVERQQDVARTDKVGVSCGRIGHQPTVAVRPQLRETLRQSRHFCTV